MAVCYDSNEAPHHVIPSTWAFKCKRYPDGRIKKFKACFCARGNKQLEGIDFFETYAPVVQWTTIRLMFILEILLGLKSKQGDVLCARNSWQAEVIARSTRYQTLRMDKNLARNYSTMKLVKSWALMSAHSC